MAEAAGKRINVEWVKDPVGVQSRNFSNPHIYSTGWRAHVSTLEGIRQTGPWIEGQVKAARAETGKALCKEGIYPSAGCGSVILTRAAVCRGLWYDY